MRAACALSRYGWLQVALPYVGAVQLLTWHPSLVCEVLRGTQVRHQHV